MSTGKVYEIQPSRLIFLKQTLCLTRPQCRHSDTSANRPLLYALSDLPKNLARDYIQSIADTSTIPGLVKDAKHHKSLNFDALFWFPMASS